MPFLKALLALFLSFIAALNPFDGPNEVAPRPSHKNFEYLEYPAEAIKEPSDVGLTHYQYASRADDDGDELFVNAQGYTDINGIITSPYFTARVEKTDIPVYATPVFIGKTKKGALHSFCEVYVDTSSGFPFDFILNAHGFIIENVTVFPRSANLKPTRNKTVIHEKITKLGTYTFVFNNDDQEHALTLFVRELVDEDKEIAELKSQYGDKNVYVVEKGFYPMDYVNVVGGKNVIYYLKRGAYLLASHKYDINNDTDSANISETNALNDTAIGLNRYPFLNFKDCDTVKILGNGIIDLSHLDRAERRGAVFTFSNNIEVRGVKFVNPPEWCFITYRCNNVKIKDVDIFGYRQNSDAYAICNSQNVSVDNSLCRSGDDLFDVKTLGGDENAISDNTTFTNCTAWNGKARCFGICGEVNKPITNVTFKDSTVIFHDATWDENRIPALAIVVENSGGSIDGVTYENIDVYQTYSRAIGCLIYGDNVENFKISNVTYKNVRYNATKKTKVASNSKTTNTIQTTFENVHANSNKITDVNTTFFEYDKYATITVN